MQKLDKTLRTVALGATLILIGAIECTAAPKLNFVVDTNAVDALADCSASMVAAATYNNDAPIVAGRVRRAIQFLSKVATNTLPDNSARLPELVDKYNTLLISNPMDARDNARDMVKGCLKSLNKAQSIRKTWLDLAESATTDPAELREIAAAKVEAEAAEIKAQAEADGTN